MHDLQKPQTIIMALAMAINLAGLKVDDYSSLLAYLTSDNDRPSSPSTRSDSSGVSSGCAPSTRTTISPPSSLSSESETANEDNTICPSSLSSESELIGETKKIMSAIGSGRRKPKKNQEKKLAIELDSKTRQESNKRNILDLMTNIKDSRWKVTHPDLLNGGVKNFMQNRSVYFRLSEDGLAEDYPIRECQECNFREPSPYLCR